MYWFGLTYDLKMFSKETIEKGKLQMCEKALVRQMSALHWGPPDETLPTWTSEQVAEFGKLGEKLMVCEGYVHDVRGFLNEHPAGAGIMKPYLNKDITKQFNGSIYNHSNAARNILRTLRVAKLAPPTSSVPAESADGEAAEVVVEEAAAVPEKLKVL